MANITCCKDCTSRAIGCHGTCERYNNEKKEHRKDKELRLNFLKKEHILDDARLKGMHRMKVNKRTVALR